MLMQRVFVYYLLQYLGIPAGGSAKQARNRENQAIMPLRGKILNTWEVDSQEILGSQEVHDISVALGVDPALEDVDRNTNGVISKCVGVDSREFWGNFIAFSSRCVINHFC